MCMKNRKVPRRNEQTKHEWKIIIGHRNITRNLLARLIAGLLIPLGAQAADDETLDKVKDKRIQEGDEIRAKFDNAGNKSKSFKTTAGCCPPWQSASVAERKLSAISFLVGINSFFRPK